MWNKDNVKVNQRQALANACTMCVNEIKKHKENLTNPYWTKEALQQKVNSAFKYCNKMRKYLIDYKHIKEFEFLSAKIKSLRKIAKEKQRMLDNNEYIPMVAGVVTKKVKKKKKKKVA